MALSKHDNSKLAPDGYSSLPYLGRSPDFRQYLQDARGVLGSVRNPSPPTRRSSSARISYLWYLLDEIDLDWLSEHITTEERVICYRAAFVTVYGAGGFRTSTDDAAGAWLFRQKKRRRKTLAKKREFLANLRKGYQYAS